MDRVQGYMNQWARERPDLDPRPMGVASRIARSSAFLAVSVRDGLRRFDVEPWEFDVLATLKRAGVPHTLTPKELVNNTMVGNAAMTHRVDKLVERGLVSRRTDPDNRRRLMIALTSHGLEMVDAIIGDHINNYAKFFGGLTAQECEMLNGLLEKLLLSHEDTWLEI